MQCVGKTTLNYIINVAAKDRHSASQTFPLDIETLTEPWLSLIWDPVSIRLTPVS